MHRFYKISLLFLFINLKICFSEQKDNYVFFFSQMEGVWSAEFSHTSGSRAEGSSYAVPEGGVAEIASISSNGTVYWKGNKDPREPEDSLPNSLFVEKVFDGVYLLCYFSWDWQNDTFMLMDLSLGNLMPQGEEFVYYFSPKIGAAAAFKSYSAGAGFFEFTNSGFLKNEFSLGKKPVYIEWNFEHGNLVKFISYDSIFAKYSKRDLPIAKLNEAAFKFNCSRILSLAAYNIKINNERALKLADKAEREKLLKRYDDWDEEKYLQERLEAVRLTESLGGKWRYLCGTKEVAVKAIQSPSFQDLRIFFEPENKIPTENDVSSLTKTLSANPTAQTAVSVWYINFMGLDYKTLDIKKPKIEITLVKTNLIVQKLADGSLRQGSEICKYACTFNVGREILWEYRPMDKNESSRKNAQKPPNLKWILDSSAIEEYERHIDDAGKETWILKAKFIKQANAE